MSSATHAAANSRDGAALVATDDFASLLRLCADLTAPRPIEDLLDSLLDDARRLVRAIAGSVYVVYGERLRFICAHNDASPHAREVAAPLSERPWATLRGIMVPIDSQSVAGYVASTGQPIRIDDVYSIDPSAPYRFDPSYDLKFGFRTRSMVAVPLREQGNRVLGVLQVLNRKGDGGQVEPFTPRDQQILLSVGAVAAVSLRNAQLREELIRSHLDTILRLATAAEFRDGETGDHIRRMSCYCEAVARKMGLSREWARQILVASPMHDVGKLGIPDAVLMKPGPLTAEERKLMQQHTVIGARILEGGDNELLRQAQRIAHSHHERWDGSGYPEGISGADIPLEARIAAVADVFDALTSPRVYKSAISFEKSFDMIRAGRGSHFDPDVADAFVDLEEDVRAIHEAYQPV